MDARIIISELAEANKRLVRQEEVGQEAIMDQNYAHQYNDHDSKEEAILKV